MFRPLVSRLLPLFRPLVSMPLVSVLPPLRSLVSIEDEGRPLPSMSVVVVWPDGSVVVRAPVSGLRVWTEPSGNFVVSVPSLLSVVVEPSGLVKVSPGLRCVVVTWPEGSVTET